MIDCDTVQEHRHFDQIISIFLLLLISFALLLLFAASGSIQTAVAIKTTGGGTTPCSPLLCGKPIPQSVIKSFTAVTEMSSKGYVFGYDFSVSGKYTFIKSVMETSCQFHSVYFQQETSCNF